MAQFVAAITIKLVAFPAPSALLLTGADNFGDPFKAAEKWRALVMQADQQPVMLELVIVVAQDYGHLIGFRVIAACVRNEGRVRVLPQQFVQRVTARLIGQADDGVQPMLHGFVAQLASGAQLVG